MYHEMIVCSFDGQGNYARLCTYLTYNPTHSARCMALILKCQTIDKYLPLSNNGHRSANARCMILIFQCQILDKGLRIVDEWHWFFKSDIEKISAIYFQMLYIYITVSQYMRFSKYFVNYFFLRNIFRNKKRKLNL